MQNVQSILKTVTISVFALLPNFVFAQTPTNFAEVVNVILDLLFLLVPLITVLAILAFMWGGAQAILNSNDPAKKAQAKQAVFWGIITLLVMGTFWGILSIIRGTFF